MNDRLISARPLVFAVAIVLVLRLLALHAPVGLAGEGQSLNQTIPTMTPTPLPVTPSATPSVLPPTSVTEPTSSRRTPTPGPISSATPAPATPTSSPGPTQLALTATQPPTSPEATLALGATLPPPSNTPPLPEVTMELPTPAVGEASATPPPVSVAPGQAASPTAIQAQPTLPPWTPGLAGTAAASGASCLWPVAGLSMVVLGTVLLGWRSRQNKKR